MRRACMACRRPSGSAISPCFARRTHSTCSTSIDWISFSITRWAETRDCYSDPEQVYRVAKARGMDLVTITDHDSIDGCLEFLDRHPDADDFFISEEIECRFPDLPFKIHVAAYGITEAIHGEARRLRTNANDVVAYLRAQRVCFALNHLFFFYRPSVPLDRYLAAVAPFPAFEGRNGAMLRA